MKNELRRMLFNGWFVMGICFLLVLCFFSEIIVTGEHSYTMLQIMQNIRAGTNIQGTPLVADSILHNAFSGYTSLFVPVVSALPMIRLLYIENRSGYKRFYMSRKSYRNYYWDKWIAGMFCGAAMLFVVAVLFQGIVLCVLPGVVNRIRIWKLVEIYIGIFFYGACSVITAIAVSSFTNNLYFIICVPFMFTYFRDVTVSEIINILSRHQMGTGLSDVIGCLFSRSYLNIAISAEDFRIEGCRAVSACLLLWLIYHFYLCRRRDLGE